MLGFKKREKGRALFLKGRVLEKIRPDQIQETS
jgi:hypothetical protein